MKRNMIEWFVFRTKRHKRDVIVTQKVIILKERLHERRGRRRRKRRRRRRGKRKRGGRGGIDTLFCAP